MWVKKSIFIIDPLKLFWMAKKRKKKQNERKTNVQKTKIELSLFKINSWNMRLIFSAIKFKLFWFWNDNFIIETKGNPHANNLGDYYLLWFVKLY